MNKNFERKILAVSNEAELENAIKNGPNGCMTDMRFWTDRMIDKAVTITEMPKEEFIDMINCGRLLLLDEQYDSEIIEQEMNKL